MSKSFALTRDVGDVLSSKTELAEFRASVVASQSETLPTMERNGLYICKAEFDVDDTLWPYTKTIAETLDISYDSWTDFHNRNPNYTQEQKDRITKVYHDPMIYDQLVFYPGFEEILMLEEYGVKVQFNSTSYTQTLLDIKHRRMMEAVPDLRPSQFKFRLVTVENNIKKDFDDDTMIAVDDNPHAVARSKAKYAIMPAVPWNQTPQALAMVAHKKVFYTPAGDLYAVYRIIIDLALSLRRSGAQ